jgi:hypothetical protein
MIESEQQEQYEVKQTSLETFDIVRHQEAMIRLQNIIFEWFIDKFMPMPTWSEDWRKQLETYRALSIYPRSEK